MSQRPRLRLKVGLLFWWGLLGMLFALFFSVAVFELGGQSIFTFIAEMNRWLLAQVGKGANPRDGEVMLAVQVVALGFAGGVAFRYYGLRDSPD